MINWPTRLHTPKPYKASPTPTTPEQTIAAPVRAASTLYRNSSPQERLLDDGRSIDWDAKRDRCQHRREIGGPSESRYGLCASCERRRERQPHGNGDPERDMEVLLSKRLPLNDPIPEADVNDGLDDKTGYRLKSAG